MPKSGKGSSFERFLSIEISKWWTQDLSEPREDVFWRSSNSGGRATVRSRKGKTTSGHYGDISATDEVGKPFLQAICLEVKRGYNKDTFANLIDASDDAAKQTYIQWIDQARLSAQNAKSQSWMIIHKRDRREALIIMPLGLANDLEGQGIYWPIPYGEIHIKNELLTIVRLKDWFKVVKPDHVKELLKS